MMRKRKLLTYLVVCAVGYVFWPFFFTPYLSPTDRTFSEVHQCPACYGTDLCPAFQSGELVLEGWTTIRVAKLVNSKNVYYGRLRGQKVVLKKLGSDSELREADDTLCRLANASRGCDTTWAVRQLASQASRNDPVPYLKLLVNKPNRSEDLTYCPSKRFIRLLYSKITAARPKSTPGGIVAEVYYAAVVNPEPLVLQAFPPGDGWPFPQYKGACGRTIVVENAGAPLQDYEDAPWQRRADIAYQLLHIAEQLTNNPTGFALYLVDVSLDNFGISPEGKVVVIDGENIIVVDRHAVYRERPTDWNKPHYNLMDGCPDCMSFDSDELCARDIADHNYYAVCKGILAPDAYFSTRGFLHGIPASVMQSSELQRLILDCAKPPTPDGRFAVAPQLMQLLKKLSVRS